MVMEAILDRTGTVDEPGKLADPNEKEVYGAASYRPEERISEIYAGSDSDNRVLARRIIQKYLENPISSLKREQLVRSALEKFHNKELTERGEKEMERYVISTYGQRGLNIINVIKNSAEKNIEYAFDNLSSFGGGLKKELEKIIREEHPEILLHKKVFRDMAIIEKTEYAGNADFARMKEHYQNLIKNSFGHGIAKLRGLWKRLENQVERLATQIHEESEITDLIANAGYAGG